MLMVDLFVSADGFAGSDGLPAYFGYPGPDLEAWIATQTAAPHTVLMGRRTYEVLSSLPEQHRDASFEAMTRQPSVVFSRTLRTSDWPGVRIHAGDPTQEVRRLALAGADHRMRTVGSLSLVRHLLAGGVVDRLRILTFPLFAGPAGRQPAFAEAPSVALRIENTQLLDGRIQLTEYKPIAQDIPRGSEQRAPAGRSDVGR